MTKESVANAEADLILAQTWLEEVTAWYETDPIWQRFSALLESKERHEREAWSNLELSGAKLKLAQIREACFKEARTCLLDAAETDALARKKHLDSLLGSAPLFRDIRDEGPPEGEDFVDEDAGEDEDNDEEDE